MNKIVKYILVTILMGTALSSCSLTLLPEDEQTSQKYWNTKEEVEAVLGSGYYYLRSSVEQTFMWGEARGNGISFLSSGDTYTAAGLKLRQMDILPSNTLTDWGGMYKVINMANSVIKYAPSVVEKDASFNESVMKSYLSEAYFQRALAYFYLVRTFKKVPYVTEPYVTDKNPYKIPQSDGDSILNACLNDLKGSLESAKEYFPETDVSNSINSKGRATRWAITSLMADINLWLGNYNNAINECDSVINSGRIGLISGSSWFTNFFPGNSNESIFELQYSYDLGQTNSFMTWFYNGASTYYEPSSYSISLYSDEDIRGENATYYNGLFWKYAGRDQAGTTRLSTEYDQNFIVYRLAEIYLIKAEAEIMADQPDNAANDINTIRNRAGLSSISSSSSKSTMLNVLLTERQREFCGEAKNWFDLLRIAHRDNFTTYKSMIIEQIVLWSGSANNEALIRSKLNNGNAWYLPINATELERNTLLKQNEAYENL
jgi:starch-binding outer membrane protein, SusD/RagB family